MDILSLPRSEIETSKLEGKLNISNRVIVPTTTGNTHYYCRFNGRSLTQKWLPNGLDRMSYIKILNIYNKYILILCMLYKQYNIRFLRFNQLLLNKLGLENNVLFTPTTIKFEYSTLDAYYMPFYQSIPKDKSISIDMDSISINVVDEQLTIYIFKNWFLQYKWALSVNKLYSECYFLRNFLNITNGKTIIKDYRQILKDIRSTIKNKIELSETQKIELKEVIYRNNCLILIFFLCKKIIGEVIDELTIDKYRQIIRS